MPAGIRARIARAGAFQCDCEERVLVDDVLATAKLFARLGKEYQPRTHTPRAGADPAPAQILQSSVTANLEYMDVPTQR